MYKVYVLKLENGKYFIGYCKTLRNIWEQLENKGLKWLKKNPYIKILKVYNNCDKYDVDKYTKKYMEAYGIENVRGGTYYSVKLSDEIIKQIGEEFKIEERDLYKNVDKNDSDEDIIKDSFDKIESEFEIINKCARCGSNEHYSYECYVEFVDKGLIKRCKNCKEYGHIKKECPITKHQIIFEQLQKLDNKIIKVIEKIKSKM